VSRDDFVVKKRLTQALTFFHKSDKMSDKVLTNPLARVRKFAGSNPVAARYAMDGLLMALVVNIASNNNNLFALRLGAGDYQLVLFLLTAQKPLL
jgi:hypothetical protein